MKGRETMIQGVLRPFRAWTAVQAASVWNRTERDLRRAWHAFLKAAFVVLQDDADLYPWLWGRSWSWVWPLIPMLAGVFAGLMLLGLWSHQIHAGLPAAGPWRGVAIVTVLCAALLGLAVGVSASPEPSRTLPWPIERFQVGALRVIGPFLHPACLLSGLIGAVAAGPWMRSSPSRACLLFLLPVAVFRGGMALTALLRALPRPRVRLTFGGSAASSLTRMFSRLPKRGPAWTGAALAASLLFHGDSIAGFAALSFTWSLTQADILRLEGRAASLVASLPLPIETKLDARLWGVARWASSSALAVLAMIVFRFGPAAILPGALALIQAHWSCAAVGLSSSALVSLDGSLLSLQSLGFSALVGGAFSGWLFSSAMADPRAILAQAVALAFAWAMLQRARSRVVAHWPTIQERLVNG